MGRRVLARWMSKGAALTLLWVLWLAIVAVVGQISYWVLFRFDAADWANWLAVRQRFLQGAVIPFDFAAPAFGLAGLAMLGCLVLAIRFERLQGLLIGICPDMGGMWSLPVPSLSRLMPGCGDRLRSPQPARWAIWPRLHLWRSSTRSFLRFALPLAQMLRRLRHVLARTPVSAGRAGPLPAVADDPSSGMTLQDPRGLIAATADPLPVIEPPSPPLPPPAVTDRDADLAVIERIMALFEVWADPSPDWMRDALREEFDALSQEGWSLFWDFGEPAMERLAAAVDAGVQPGDPVRCRAVRARLDEYKTLSAPTVFAPTDMAGDVGDDSSDASGLAAPGPARLSMSAAWLCEMVDNFIMLEEIRAAGAADGMPSFEVRWGAVYRETRERLKCAMQAMTDEDWRSIDQFPGRAGRIRILTDRLREELRVLPSHGGDEPLTTGPGARGSDGENASPVTDQATLPFLPTDAVPADSGFPMVDAATVDAPRPVEEVLLAAGYVARRLPAARGGAWAGSSDYLVQRDDVSLLLRMVDLTGRDWRLGSDSLAPWRGPAGQALASPCRALWQSLSLMRSMGGGRPSAGLLVLSGGHFADEQAVAAVIGQDWRRTDIDVAWLDRPSSPLPDLSAWLRRFESSRMGMAVPAEGFIRPKGEAHGAV